MLQWALYALTVSALLSCAAWLMEHALRTGQRATRWSWAAALVLSPLLSGLSLSAMTAAPAMRPAGMQHSIQTLQHVAPLKLPQLLAAPATPLMQARQAHWTQLFVDGWAALSLLVLFSILASALSVMPSAVAGGCSWWALIVSRSRAMWGPRWSG